MSIHERVLINTFNTIEIIPVKDIVSLKADGNYTWIKMESGVNLLSCVSFGKISNRLLPFGFYVTHKSYTINFKHATRYHKQGSIEMVDSTMVPVARRRREHMLETLSNYASNADIAN